MIFVKDIPPPLQPPTYNSCGGILLQQGWSSSIFDGSCINAKAAGGFILRDWTGKLLKAGAANYGTTSSLIAEARALRDGVALAVQEGYSMLCIEGDNVTVIRALLGKTEGPWQISHIIEDVKAYLHQVTQVTIHHTFTEANIAADWLSKFAHLINDTFITYICFSPTLRQILADDCIGHTFMRRGG